jgi:hypothetical protein
MNQDNETDANMEVEDGLAASFGKTAKGMYISIYRKANGRSV